MIARAVPASSVHPRPMVGYTAALASALALALLLRAPALPLSVIDWDESVYLVIAQHWLRGEIPYVAVWDQHPIGLPALFALLDLLTGDGLLAARLAATVAVALTAFLCFAFCARFLENDAAGLAASFLYVLCSARSAGIPANTEIFNNALIAAASYLAFGELVRMTEEGRARITNVAVAAFLLGLGLQIKYAILLQSGFILGVPLGVALWQGERIGRVLLLAATALGAILLPFLAAGLYFLSVGAFGAFLEANFLANLTYVTILPNGLDLPARIYRGVSIVATPLAAAGLVVLFWPWIAKTLRLAERRALLWLLGLATAAAGDVCLPLKFWPHYFLLMLPSLTIIAGAATFVILPRLWPSRIAAVTVAAMLIISALPAWAAFKEQMSLVGLAQDDVPRAVSAYIRREQSADATIFVFDYQPIIYYLTGARPPMRYVLPHELSEEFAPSSGAEPEEEIHAAFDRRPDFVVVSRPGPGGLSPAVWRAVEERLSEYRLDAVFDDAADTVEVYQRER